MGGKSGTSQVRRISQYEREHGIRKGTEVPWKERDHALFVAYAPVQAPRYVCAVVVEHGGEAGRRRLGGGGADLPRRAAGGAAARPGAARAAAGCAGRKSPPNCRCRPGAPVTPVAARRR